MAIRLIRPGREFTIPIGDATFSVRRMTALEQGAFDLAHPSDAPGRIQAWLEATIIGWSGVVAEDGQPVDYDASLIAHFDFERVLYPLIERLRGGPDPTPAQPSSETAPLSNGMRNG